MPTPAAIAHAQAVTASAEFADMVRSGCTFTAIGEHFGIRPQTAADYAYRHGLRKSHAEILLRPPKTRPFAPGEWILVDYPSTQLFGVSGTFKERPAKIIQVYPRFYLCQTARGQRVCQPIVGAKRAIEIGGEGHVL